MKIKKINSAKPELDENTALQKKLVKHRGQNCIKCGSDMFYDNTPLYKCSKCGAIYDMRVFLPYLPY